MLSLQAESYVYGTMNISSQYYEHMFTVPGTHVYSTMNRKKEGREEDLPREKGKLFSKNNNKNYHKKEYYGKLLSAKAAGRHEGRREGGISQDADLHAARL